MSAYLKGRNLQKRDGDEYKPVDAEAHLAGKVVALYFSAHWCPPCRQFTPVLKDFYNDLMEEDKEFEIIFVSFDRAEADLKSYMTEAHGNWCVFPFGDPAIKELSEKYGVSGIPALVVLKPDGTAAIQNGRSDITANPPATTFNNWKAACGL
jgi:nucleoredoxin